MIEELYNGKIENEKWVPFRLKKYQDYYISNYGRVFSFKSDKFLVPTKQLNQYNYQISNRQKTHRFSIRKELLKHFKKSEIVYDYGIPPRRVLVNRIKAGKIGVYQAPTQIRGSKRWRYVIQFKNKHYAGYFHTKQGAESAWVAKYCELYKLDYLQVLRELR